VSRDADGENYGTGERCVFVVKKATKKDKGE
jgi:hypothetical protein